MVNYGYESGFKAIKHQIIPSMEQRQINPYAYEKYTFDLLNRTCPGWMRENDK